MNQQKSRKLLQLPYQEAQHLKYYFHVLSDNYARSVPWQHVHFFWGDERCVPPDNPESNYGMAQRTLLSKIEIPDVKYSQN